MPVSLMVFDSLLKHNGPQIRFSKVTPPWQLFLASIQMLNSLRCCCNLVFIKLVLFSDARRQGDWRTFSWQEKQI